MSREAHARKQGGWDEGGSRYGVDQSGIDPDRIAAAEGFWRKRHKNKPRRRGLGIDYFPVIGELKGIQPKPEVFRHPEFDWGETPVGINPDAAGSGRLPEAQLEDGSAA